jgi:hypothetical protein
VDNVVKELNVVDSLEEKSVAVVADDVKVDSAVVGVRELVSGDVTVEAKLVDVEPVNNSIVEELGLAGVLVDSVPADEVASVVPEELELIEIVDEAELAIELVEEELVIAEVNENGELVEEEV